MEEVKKARKASNGRLRLLKREWKRKRERKGKREGDDGGKVNGCHK